MKNTVKKSLAIILVLVVSISFAVSASAAAVSDSFGELTWSFDDSTGTLTVSGDGLMPAVANAEDIPWASYAEQITTINIEEGVKNISAYAFSACKNAENVNIPDSVTKISAGAFHTSVIDNEGGSIGYVDNWAITCKTGTVVATVKEGIVGIAESGFANCGYLQVLNISDSVKYVNANAFKNCGLVFEQGGVEYVSAYVTSSDPEDRHKESLALGATEDLVDLVLRPDTRIVIDAAFKDRTAIESVSIPTSILRMGESSLEGCTSISKIKFEGTETAWQSVSLGRDWLKGVNTSNITLEYDQIMPELPPITPPATTAASTTASPAPETTAADTSDAENNGSTEKKGCKSSVAAVILPVCMIGAAGALTFRKKED